MALKKIQTVCGYGCGSSLFLRMKVNDILKANGLEADVFCGDVATCCATDCDVIFISEELGEQIKNKAKVPVVMFKNFMNKKEVEEKTLAFMNKN